MAIFYNHIKGCGEGSTGLSNSTTDSWTWINWSTSTGTTNACLPEILVGSTNNKTNAQSLGKIITSDATGQSISKQFNFTNSIYVPKISFTNAKKYDIYWTTNWDSTNKPGLVLDPIQSSSSGILACLGADVHVYAQNSLVFKGTDEIVFVDEVEFLGGVSINGALTVKGAISTSDKCEASYFNAVSDRRAKSNITPAEFSALSVVNTLPIYTFQYLNNQEPVIGLIAQEAAEYNLDGFNMVDNLDATGECGDFMQMKESKLVYVLWKAVQELSAEVEELKAEIRSLK